MRLLFVADGRSPIAVNWIQGLIERGHEVHLASTYPCSPELQLASFEVVPVAFSRAKAEGVAGKQAGLIWGAAAVGLRTTLRQWLGPLTLHSAAGHLRLVIARVQPDLVHAMRIPYEGMVAALADPEAPLVISVWGNDFTLHAPSTPWMSYNTRRALRRADGLHTDCHRDARLALNWGFLSDLPVAVLPGGGGVQMDLFCPPEGVDERAQTARTVINPRGFRAYIRNEAFFRAIPLVLERQPSARFLCPGMAGEPQVFRWLEELRIRDSVTLLPHQSRPQMAQLFRQSQVAVSPSFHDGTPNTLLEAMACGCFPVAGDIESLREWIRPGDNGLLVDPVDPQALAQAILLALEQPKLRERAAIHNLRLIAERAERGRVMASAEEFYRRLLNS